MAHGGASRHEIEHQQPVSVSLCRMRGGLLSLSRYLPTALR